MPTISAFFGIAIWMYHDHEEHGMWRVTKVTAIGPYRLAVEFEDGVKGEIDLSDRLFGPVFQPLKDPTLFGQVSIDEFGVIRWPNGADLAPDALYETLAARAHAK